MVKYLIFFSLLGCIGKSEYTKDECETLSLETYRGSPKSAHLHKKHCGEYKLKYTQAYCQKSLQDLILDGRALALKQKYGDRILECFDQGQKEKFLR